MSRVGVGVGRHPWRGHSGVSASLLTLVAVRRDLCAPSVGSEKEVEGGGLARGWGLI